MNSSKFFQYPTSGRTAWSLFCAGYSGSGTTLSVPYLGSNCLEPAVVARISNCRQAFSTLPRVELPGA